MDLGEAEWWGCRSSCAWLDKEPCLQEPLCVLVWSHSLVELLEACWAVGKRRLGRGWRVTGRSWALACVLLLRGVHVAHTGSAEEAWWQRKFLATSSPGSQTGQISEEIWAMLPWESRGYCNPALKGREVRMCVELLEKHRLLSEGSWRGNHACFQPPVLQAASASITGQGSFSEPSPLISRNTHRIKES